jgi:hypothetical protein
MDIYKKTEKFVVDAFAKSGKPTDVHHAKRTVYWVKELKPDADESLLIAGVAHDIERAFFGDWKKGSDDPKALRKHQALSAAEIDKFLRDEKYDEKLIVRVKHLIACHEEGGDEDQNILCDADCLAYFEEKALRQVKKHKAEDKPAEEMKTKLDYNFHRIHSEKAKQIGKKWYNEAVEELEI